jgi:pimeloyl-ACP methyl ester carboxylesterase
MHGLNAIVNWLEDGRGRGAELIERSVPFTTADGVECKLINVRGTNPPTREPVILVHGAGVRANIFRAPVARTLVDTLVEHGFDVWLEDWRASIDLPRRQWTLDQAAVFDHPAAVKTVVAETGVNTVKAVIHCQGSTSFMMSALAGLIPEVKTVVSNAVSLHTVIPPVSRLKITYLAPIIRRLTPYLNPRWGVEAPTVVAKTLVMLVRLLHHECDNAVCKMVSFTYGTGFPALWRHENLNDETHEWLKEEFADVPMTFFSQMARCVQAGHLVSVEDRPELPRDFLAQPPQTDARFAFFAGRMNRCFSHVGQERTFEYFDQRRKGYHSLYVLPTYSHLDVFMGKDAARDVFPQMLAELAR